MPQLILYHDYSRQDVQEIFDQEAKFTPGAGTPLGFLEYNVPKAAITFEVFLGAFSAGHLLCEPVGKIEVGW